MLHFFSQHLHHRLLVVLYLISVFGFEVIDVGDFFAIFAVVEGALGVHLEFDIFDLVNLQIAVFHQDRRTTVFHVDFLKGQSLSILLYGDQEAFLPQDTRTDIHLKKDLAIVRDDCSLIASPNIQAPFFRAVVVDGCLIVVASKCEFGHIGLSEHVFGVDVEHLRDGHDVFWVFFEEVCDGDFFDRLQHDFEFEVFLGFVELSYQDLRLSNVLSSPDHITLRADKPHQFLELRVHGMNDLVSESIAVGWQFRCDIK